MAASTNAVPQTAVANQPVSGSPSRRPKTRSTAKPASATPGRSQMTSSTSAPQQRDVVGVGAGPASQDGHDDAESDHDLGRGDDQHEEDGGLAVDVVEADGEGDERQVDGVEHELDA